MKGLLPVTFLLTLAGCASSADPYQPTWESLDKRPLPEWYDDSKFGIFLHWGVYSVPSFGSEWFWSNWKGKADAVVEYMNKTYPPGFTYQQFAPELKAEFFNASKWADIFRRANAKYVVLTSKHHEGFTMWPSSRAFSWNAMDVGPHRDIVGELSTAVVDSGLHFGLYYSLYEWFNPLYLQDKRAKFATRTFVEQKVMPELHELIADYRPEVIWTDGDWEASDVYWNSTGFLAWLYNESPVRDTIVVNDRWGMDIPCHHGGYYTCTDRFNPGVLQKHKWENCMTVDRSSWGFRRNAALSDFLTVHDIIKELTTTVSCGGNLLMNVGPTKEGTIAPIFQDRLDGIGRWLDLNGEAIFKTKPWLHQNDSLNSDVWYTQSKSQPETVFVVVLQWPTDNMLVVADLNGRISQTKSKITMLGSEEKALAFKGKGDSKVYISFPDMASVKSRLAWALRVTDVGSG